MPNVSLTGSGLRFSLLSLMLTGFLFSACKKNKSTDTPVVARGSRHLGAHLSVAGTGTYPDAYYQARSAGVDCVPFTLQWSAIEKNGIYDSADLLGALNGFYAGQPVSLSICVSPFAADRRDMPADLMNTAFDDPLIIDRFDLLLDSIHARLSGTSLRYLVLGNEVDLYLSGHVSEWAAYTRFCRAVRIHAQALWGNELKTGAETTLGATIGSGSEVIKTLQDSMDLICLTYYPLQADFFMEPSTSVVADFDQLLTLYPARPLMFQEIGYATGAACGGSDSAQMNFVKQVFSLWDSHSEQIQFIAFLWLNDLSAEQAMQVTQDYGLAGTPAETAFTEYIRTLGLCNEQGTPKPGFTTMQQEALKRGWSN